MVKNQLRHETMPYFPSFFIKPSDGQSSFQTIIVPPSFDMNHNLDFMEFFNPLFKFMFLWELMVQEP